MKAETQSGRIGSGALLEIWWQSMPEWAKHAYHNDTTFRCVVLECAAQECTREEMQWRLASALFDDRNRLKKALFQSEKCRPIAVDIPRDQLERISKYFP